MPSSLLRINAIRGLIPLMLAPSELQALGHDALVVDLNGVHAIVRIPGGWSAGADSRREGIARGD